MAKGDAPQDGKSAVSGVGNTPTLPPPAAVTPMPVGGQRMPTGPNPAPPSFSQSIAQQGTGMPNQFAPSNQAAMAQNMLNRRV